MVPAVVDARGAVVVGPADHLLPFDAATGKERGERLVVMVAAEARVEVRRAAKLPRRDNDRFVEEALTGLVTGCR
jgi:hypothetical protein